MLVHQSGALGSGGCLSSSGNLLSIHCLSPTPIYEPRQCYDPHFADEETEAWNDVMTYQKTTTSITGKDQSGLLT